MSIVTDFKSIRRKLERQEQKAEFEEKNPPPAMYGWPYGVAVPMAITTEEGGEWLPFNAAIHGEGALIHSAKFADGREWDVVNGWRGIKI